VYGRLIGCPTLKPHDLRHGVALEVLEQHHEDIRALLGHARIDTTQIYPNIRPAERKRAVAFYETKAIERGGPDRVPRPRCGGAALERSPAWSLS
jgi:integrase